MFVSFLTALATLAVFGAEVGAQKVAMPMPMPMKPFMPPPPLGDGNSNETIKYVLTFPSIIQKSRDFIFNVILFQNPGYSLPVSFTANLTANEAPLATQTFTQTKYGLQSHKFTNIKTASLGEDSYPNIHITFTSEGLKNYTDIDGSERLLADTFVFIQTDKAMYKPTHTVLIRAVVVDRSLNPVNGVVNVTLQDAKSNQLKMWKNQQLTKGVFSGSYQLSDFVNLGDWTITLNGKGIPTTQKTFTVQQYVLPKYEVKLDFSPANKNGFWLFNGDTESGYKGSVKAKYTFGKPVKGTATITLQKTGYCNYTYDSSDFSFGPVIRLAGPIGSFPTPPKPKKLSFNVSLAGDGSEDDGKFTFKGINPLITSVPYQPPNSMQSRSPVKPQMNSNQCQLLFQVNVTEELTGEKISGEGTVALYRDPYQISVHDSVQKTLKPGLPFTMRFQISTPDGQPAEAGIPVDQEIYYFNETNPYQYGQVKCGTYSYYGNNEMKPAIPAQKLRATTDSDGLVSIKADTIPKGTTMVLFKASVAGTTVDICDQRYPPQSDNKQSISIAIDRPIAEAKKIPKVGDKLTFKIQASFEAPMVYFMLVQNGQPLVYKQLTNPTAINAGSTTYSVDAPLPQDASPRCSAVVWTVGNFSTAAEVLADAIEFKVDGLIRQNVTASFSPATVRPGEPTTLTVSTTEPNSYVALLAVDKSVRLLKSGNDIALDDVMGAVGEGSQSGGYRPVMPLMWRCWRCGWFPWWIDSSNAESVFSGVGMVVKSNVRTGPPRMFYRGFGGGPMVVMAAGRAAPGGMPLPAPMAPPMMANGAMAKGQSPATAESASKPPTVRLLFPETWIWQNNTTNAQGRLALSLKAPDTITSWDVTAFTVGDTKGFGAMQEPTQLTVFQDFFVNLDIGRPTIIRGEQVQLKAVIFNYLTEPTSVDVLLKKSNDFEVSSDGGNTYSSADFKQNVEVQANGGNSIPIWVRPKRLGKINMTLQGVGENGFSDAMQKEVLVEPEGEVRYANKPVFVRLTPENNELKANIEVAKMLGEVTDDQIVEGSRMYQLQGIGDILGPSLSQLGNQIRLPTGCGEQTMLTLAPNVYIYNYLKSVNLMTDELQAKTTGFVDQGYQHELTYQREDGGFSAFGNSDTESSTWLTAFVLRCFAAAKKYVGTQIPDDPVTRGWGFIGRQKLSNGTFKEPGRVIHSSMKGGSGSDVSLAAYVYTTAAEAGMDMSPYTNCRNLFISKAMNNATRDPYQLALFAYALSIRKEDRTSGLQVMKRLMGLASMDGGFTYWKPQNDQSELNEYEQSGPTQIETSAYALLAHMNLNNLTDDAIPIGRWLMTKRNSLGGFASTQDTVVGLQAIANLASRMTSDGQDFTIDSTLTYEDNAESLTKQFSINADNAQLLQSFDPPRGLQYLTNADLSIQGVGVGLVQLAMRYNVRDNKALDSGDYNIIVVRDSVLRKRRQADNSEALPDKEITLKGCARALQFKTGMVLMEIGIPTGFEADLEATQAANKNSSTNGYFGALKRIELGDRRVVFYFNTFEYNKNCVSVKITRTMAAKNVQAPIARVYSYYEPSRTNATEFTFPGMSIDQVTEL